MGVIPLVLKPLTAELLPAVVELDRLCFNGLWTLDAYQREIESPNSDLLGLWIPQADDQEDALTRRTGDAESDSSQARELIRGEPENSSSSESPDQEDALSGRQGRGESFSLQVTASSSGRPQVSVSERPLQALPILGVGCQWAIVDEAHITMVAVHPHYRGQGLGQALLFALLKSARTRGLERATLEVRESNQAALSLYQKFGFQTAGRRRRYYQDNNEDALILWRSGLLYPEFEQTLACWYGEISARLAAFGWNLD